MTTDPQLRAEDDLVLFLRGGSREVYLRPKKPSQLVKVPGDVRRKRLARSGNLFSRLKARLPARSYRYRYVMREFAAYWRAMQIGATLGRQPPIVHLRGLMLTEHGVGQVVQKIRDADGQPAPTLRQLFREGRLDDRMVDLLNVFAADLLAFRIVAPDLGPKNVVFETRHGRDRFVLVDGFGDQTLIPVRRMFPALNRRRMAQDLGNLAGRLQLEFDAGAWRFSRPTGAGGGALASSPENRGDHGTQDHARGRAAVPHGAASGEVRDRAVGPDGDPARP